MLDESLIHDAASSWLLAKTISIEVF